MLFRSIADQEAVAVAGHRTPGEGKLATGAADFERAAANLLEARELHERLRGANDPQTVGCMRALVDVYAAWEKFEPGKGHAEAAAAWQAKVPSGK